MNSDYRFQYSKTEMYTLRQFYDNFHTQLPLWVMITEGNDGMTSYDDFCSDQVIRFAKVCTQRRVIARESREATRQTLEYLSIPVKSIRTYQVVEGPNKVGPVELLETIMSKKEPPFIVRLSRKLPDDFVIKSDGHAIDLLIIKEYVENYLQGNCYMSRQAGLLDLPCTACLTPEISVSLIEGIKREDPEEFENLKRDMNEFVQVKVKFDDEIDNQDIYRYKIGDPQIRGLVSSDEFFPDTDIYGSPELPPRKGEVREDTYEYLQPDPEWVPAKPPKPETDKNATHKGGVTTPEHNPERKRTVYNKARPPPLLPRDTSPSSSSGYTDFPTGYMYTTHPTEDEDVYAVPEAVEVEEKSQKEPSSCAHDVENLSIKELGKIMKKLKLDKYVKKFNKECVDGMLISKLDENVLKSDFKFSQIEALRLMTFVRTGHIPE